MLVVQGSNDEITGPSAEAALAEATAVFVGNPGDVVPESFGPDLPMIPDWTTAHYDHSGYITGFDPTELADRRQLGYRDDERVRIVTVGGSGVGGDLLKRVVAAYPEAKRLVPDLRMVVVTGPRIDPSTLPQPEGLDVRASVDELYRHLASCDLAVVQGGLTTAMELTAGRRPFLYFPPLRHHFEQNFHVRHRLEQYPCGCVPRVQISRRSRRASSWRPRTCGRAPRPGDPRARAPGRRSVRPVEGDGLRCTPGGVGETGPPRPTRNGVTRLESRPLHQVAARTVTSVRLLRGSGFRPSRHPRRPTRGDRPCRSASWGCPRG